MQVQTDEVAWLERMQRFRYSFQRDRIPDESSETQDSKLKQYSSNISLFLCKAPSLIHLEIGSLPSLVYYQDPIPYFP